MSTVIVLGGCGAVGRVAVQTLAQQECIERVILGDINSVRAEEVRLAINSPKVTVQISDVSTKEAVKQAIAGTDLVVNCTGPFYKFVQPILSASIELKINYVDVCDDVDVTKDILKLDAQAKESGIIALIGMGSSPGVTNLLAKFAAEMLLDSVETIDLYHAHGGEPYEGEGVIAHRFHCMTIPVPLFTQGQGKEVDFFSPEGIAQQEVVDFKLLGKHRVYPYPHPETITLPQFIKGVKRVTNKGTVLPAEYYQLTLDVVQAGLHSKEPLEVKGQSISPYDLP